MSPPKESDLPLSEAELEQFDALLASLETFAARFAVLSTTEKARVLKAPGDANSWMAGMLIRAHQNLGRLPRDFDPAEAQQELALDAALAPRELRLARVLDRIACARLRARSGAFSTLLGVRRTLQQAGLAGVDDELSEGLRRYFKCGGKGVAAGP